MAERYFNLKIGSEKVNGGIIRVNPDETDLEKRIQEFGGELRSGRGVSPYEFKVLEREREAVTYELEIKDEKYINVEGIPVAVKAGPPTVMKLRVASAGELSLDRVPEGIKVYLSEISKEKAEKLKEEAENFSLLRAYVLE